MLEIKDYDGEGLATLVSGGGWDVLMLNYLPRLGHGAVTQLHRHTETKETKRARVREFCCHFCGHDNSSINFRFGV